MGVSSWVGGRRRGWWALRCRGESQLLGLKKQAVRYWSCAPPCFLLIPLRSQGWLDQCQGCSPVSFMRHGDKLELSHVWWQTSTRDKVRAWIQKPSEAFRQLRMVCLQFMSMKIFCRPNTEDGTSSWCWLNLSLSYFFFSSLAYHTW